MTEARLGLLRPRVSAPSRPRRSGSSARIRRRQPYKFGASPFLATIPRDDDADARRPRVRRPPIKRDGDMNDVQSPPRGEAPDVREAVRQGGRRVERRPGGDGDPAAASCWEPDRRRRVQRSAVDVANDKRALHAISSPCTPTHRHRDCQAAEHAAHGEGRPPTCRFATLWRSSSTRACSTSGIKESAKAPDAKYAAGTLRRRCCRNRSAGRPLLHGRGRRPAARRPCTTFMRPNPRSTYPADRRRSPRAPRSIQPPSTWRRGPQRNARAKLLHPDPSLLRLNADDPTSREWIVLEDAAAVAGVRHQGRADAATQHSGRACSTRAVVHVRRRVERARRRCIASTPPRLLLLGRSLGPEKMRRITAAGAADPVVEEVDRVEELRRSSTSSTPGNGSILTSDEIAALVRSASRSSRARTGGSSGTKWGRGPDQDSNGSLEPRILRVLAAREADAFGGSGHRLSSPRARGPQTPNRDGLPVSTQHARSVPRPSPGFFHGPQLDAAVEKLSHGQGSARRAATTRAADEAAFGVLRRRSPEGRSSARSIHYVRHAETDARRATTRGGKGFTFFLGRVTVSTHVVVSPRRRCRARAPRIRVHHTPPRLPRRSCAGCGRRGRRVRR